MRTGHARACSGSIDRMSEGGGRALQLHHLLIQAVDLERAEEFYIDFLGLTVRKREKFRDGRPLIVTEQGLGLTDGRPAGPGPVEHIAFRSEGVRALAEAASASGIPIIAGPEPSSYGLSLYLEDPDGNKIEVFGADGDE